MPLPLKLGGLEPPLPPWFLRPWFIYTVCRKKVNQLSRTRYCMCIIGYMNKFFHIDKFFTANGGKMSKYKIKNCSQNDIFLPLCLIKLVHIINHEHVTAF